MFLSRRSFFTGLLATPLVVPAERLMRLRGIVLEPALLSPATLVEWHDLIEYRRQCILGFEQGMSLLRASIVPETTIKNNAAVFVVANRGGALLHVQ